MSLYDLIHSRAKPAQELPLENVPQTTKKAYQPQGYGRLGSKEGYTELFDRMF